MLTTNITQYIFVNLASCC